MVKGPVVSGSCPVCQNHAKSRCSSCYITFYCGPKCQKEHWKEHKATCKKPYKIDENKVCGRYFLKTIIALRFHIIVIDLASFCESLTEYIRFQKVYGCPSRFKAWGYDSP